MTHTDALARQEELQTERRDRVLEAADRCFSRAGFHRTTMQDVAAEAGMTAGNLYRYFPSKEALVLGLCERDRCRVAADFEGFRPGSADFLDGFESFGRKFFDETERDKAALCLEIWAEATRNATVARVHLDFDRDIVRHLLKIFEAAKANGNMAPDVDPGPVASILTKLADGLFVRRAIDPDFDPRREVAEVFAVVEAMLSGRVNFPRTDAEKESPCSSAASLHS
ncbi:TetR/AcrR family transcriptional regulator [Faunimonas sp. B44]|uniref:TetR/AcrR family transcriptional regulator n=1 Tax=Faunimonas sp. B44 TaxID=3461493 RepID=UPI004044B93D